MALWFVGIIYAWLLCFGIASVNLVANANQGDTKEFFQNYQNAQKGP
jgi:hypothetical protein